MVGQNICEDIVEDDGIEFCITRAKAPSPDMLEQGLKDVQALYEWKFGHSSGVEVVEHDGVKFLVTRGASSLDALEQRLEEVKGLYEEKFGHFVNDEVDETMSSSSSRTEQLLRWMYLKEALTKYDTYLQISSARLWII
jgi:hypothetical protein